MENLAYHCSADGNIKELIPQTSSHEKPYVYATPYKIISLVFGIKGHCDYIIHPIIDENGNCTIVEMSPNALTKYYRNKNAYIYTVNSNEFNIRTQWRGEICSSTPVKPLDVEYIPDLEKAILQEQNVGHINIVCYEERNNNGVNMDERFANRELKIILNKYNNLYTQKRINYLKELENKEIFRCFYKQLNHYFDCFKNKEQISSEEVGSIIPQPYLEKYKVSCDDNIISEIFENFSYLPIAKISQAIDEIKSAKNTKLLQKIIYRLTEIHNVCIEFLSDKNDYSSLKLKKSYKSR